MQYIFGITYTILATVAYTSILMCYLELFRCGRREDNRKTISFDHCSRVFTSIDGRFRRFLAHFSKGVCVTIVRLIARTD